MRALRHFDVIISPALRLGSCGQLLVTTELLGPGQTVGLAISGLGPLTVCTKSGRCLESEAPIRYPSLKRPGLESGAALLIPDEKLLMRFKS